MIRSTLQIAFLVVALAVPAAGQSEPVVLVQAQFPKCNGNACELETGMGNGVIIDNNGSRLLIATAGHCISSQQGIQVWCAQQWRPASRHHHVYNKLDDFGVIEVAGSFPDVPFLRVHPGPIRPGTPMLIDAYWPGQPKWQHRQLRGVLQLFGNAWQMNRPIIQGVSGAPVLVDGKLAGIATGNDQTRIRQPTLTWMTSLDRIRYHLDRWGYADVLNDRATLVIDQPESDLGEAVTDDAESRKRDKLLYDAIVAMESRLEELRRKQGEDIPDTQTDTEADTTPAETVPHDQPESGLDAEAIADFLIRKGISAAWPAVAGALGLGTGAGAIAIAWAAFSFLRKRRKDDDGNLDRRTDKRTQERTVDRYVPVDSDRNENRRYESFDAASKVDREIEKIRQVKRPWRDESDKPRCGSVEVNQYFTLSELDTLARSCPPSGQDSGRPTEPEPTQDSQAGDKVTIPAGSIKFPTQPVDYSKVWTDHMWATGVNPAYKALELSFYVEAFNAVDRGVLELPDVANPRELIAELRRWVNREFRQRHQTMPNFENVHHKAFYAFLHEKVTNLLRQGTYQELPQLSRAADAIEEWVDARLVEQQVLQRG